MVFILAVPGYGKSKNETLGPVSNEEFMAAVVSLLQIKPVIISPSMSGGFALPYLFEDPLQSTEKAIGYIPVAPVLTANWEQNYPKSQVRSFAIVQMRKMCSWKRIVMVLGRGNMSRWCIPLYVCVWVRSLCHKHACHVHNYICEHSVREAESYVCLLTHLCLCLSISVCMCCHYTFM